MTGTFRAKMGNRRFSRPLSVRGLPCTGRFWRVWITSNFQGEAQSKAMADHHPEQLLHLVFGGELVSPDKMEFKDLNKLDMVGMYPNYAEALKAWRGNAQSTVDNAQMRYFVVHIHRLMEPEGHHE